MNPFPSIIGPLGLRVVGEDATGTWISHEGNGGSCGKFPEIQGTFFYNWGCVDRNHDGEIDSGELYDYLRDGVG